MTTFEARLLGIMLCEPMLQLADRSPALLIVCHLKVLPFYSGIQFANMQSYLIANLCVTYIVILHSTADSVPSERAAFAAEPFLFNSRKLLIFVFTH